MYNVTVMSRYSLLYNVPAYSFVRNGLKDKYVTDSTGLYQQYTEHSFFPKYVFNINRPTSTHV